MRSTFTSISLALLSVAMGFLFLYSAYTKVIPIQTFEYTMVEFVSMPWWMAAVAARLFVGIEAGLGILLTLNAFGTGKWVLKAALALLAVFSIYLVYLWVTRGNDVNCGCFGDAIWMSPSASLLKNVVMITLLAILYRWNDGIHPKMLTGYFTGMQYGSRLSLIKKCWASLGRFTGSAYSSHLAKGIGLLMIVMAFVLYPIPDTKPFFLNKDAYEINLSAIYSQNPPPAVDVRTGKHIIAFMSLTCPHCKMAAYKMELMRRDNPGISMFLVLNGDSTDLAPFWEKTNAREIPHTMLLGRDFIELAGLSLPAIYWLNNGHVEAQSTYIDLNQAEIEKWMGPATNAQ